MAGKVAKPKTSSPIQAPSFEERLEELEALAEKMEQGNLPLHELLKDYEAGLKLSKALEEELEKAQARMQEVKEGKGGSPELVPSQVVSQGSLLDEIMLDEMEGRK